MILIKPSTYCFLASRTHPFFIYHKQNSPTKKLAHSAFLSIFDVVAISAHHVDYHAFTEKYFFAPLITSLYIFPLSSQSHPTTTHNITGLHFN